MSSVLNPGTQSSTLYESWNRGSDLNLSLIDNTYKIDIMVFWKVSAKIKLPPVGIELTAPTIKGLEF